MNRREEIDQLPEFKTSLDFFYLSDKFEINNRKEKVRIKPDIQMVFFIPKRNI